MASIEMRHPNSIFGGSEGGLALIFIAVLGIAIVASKGKPFWARGK
jgi:hypothetical protein